MTAEPKAARSSPIAVVAPRTGQLAAYEPLLSLARDNPSRVALHAGFIPRPYARIVMRESLAAALEAAKAKGYVAADEECSASESHCAWLAGSSSSLATSPL